MEVPDNQSESTQEASRDFVFDAISKIRAGTDEDFKLGLLDGLVEQAWEAASASGDYKHICYQRLFYAMFAGRKCAHPSIHLKVLQAMLIFLKRGKSIQIDTLNLLRKNAWSALMEHYVSPQLMIAEPEPCEPGSFVDAGQNKDDPEALCTVNHGGGLYHVRELQEGKSKGYPLDVNRNGKFPGLGIYVTPINSGYKFRAYGYARRAATLSCDIPCVFQARIAQRYLVKTPNPSYEVGVPAEHFDKFKDLKRERLTFQDCAVYGDGNPYGDVPAISLEEFVALAREYGRTARKDFVALRADMMGEPVTL